MNKKQIALIKRDKRTNKEIGKAFGISTSTVSHIKNGPSRRMLYSASERAKENGLDFELTIDDIIIPDICPLLGIKLKSFIGTGAKTAQPNSPTLDRIDSTKGYVRGNVWVISYKANAIKNSSTFSEFELIYNNWKKFIQ